MAAETWGMLEKASSVLVAIAGSYAAFQLMLSYAFSFYAKYMSDDDAKSLWVARAQNKLQLGSLIPWPLGCCAILGAFLGIITAARNFYIAVSG